MDEATEAEYERKRFVFGCGFVVRDIALLQPWAVRPIRPRRPGARRRRSQGGH